MPEVDLQKFLVEDENGINYLIGLEENSRLTKKIVVQLNF